MNPQTKRELQELRETVAAFERVVDAARVVADECQASLDRFYENRLTPDDDDIDRAIARLDGMLGRCNHDIRVHGRMYTPMSTFCASCGADISLYKTGGD